MVVVSLLYKFMYVDETEGLGKVRINLLLFFWGIAMMMVVL